MASHQLDTMVHHPNCFSSGQTPDTIKREELWQPLISRIGQAIDDAVPDSPPHCPAHPLPYLVYWNAIFDTLLENVLRDKSIPEHVTDPPSERFEMKLFDEEAADVPCLCWLPDPVGGLNIVADGGVTKTDVVEGIQEWLFGSAAPLVNGLESGTSKSSRVVLVHSGWMTDGWGRVGPTGKRICRGQYPRVYFFGCDVKIYAEVIKILESEDIEDEENEGRAEMSDGLEDDDKEEERQGMKGMEYQEVEEEKVAWAPDREGGGLRRRKGWYQPKSSI